MLRSRAADAGSFLLHAYGRHFRSLVREELQQLLRDESADAMSVQRSIFTLCSSTRETEDKDFHHSRAIEKLFHFYWKLKDIS